MRKLVMLVCIGVVATPLLSGSSTRAGIIPSWEASSGKFGFYPISNELSAYQNYDDAGKDRGRTLQIVSINSLKLFTNFSFEFTADYNWDFSYADPFDLSAGKNNHDYYIELSIVKPLTGALSVNVQRIIATFEAESVNQVGLRLSF
ncbi:MAG: hypothetical protein KAW91_06915 [candidate division Zixibacteria bacterium]|nr:hypothetical protein [candidate division Zixibacteria bacterium]